ncbi:MAG: DNA internalization-related competence protein ComEC/Rec2 [Gammaproteobacteria bacterium]|nr:DNA internalization-related competence protein ComEC/Rec2 [Gammaproteobacteria bacterium]
MHNLYSFNPYIKGIVTLKGDNYILLKEKMHYIKVYVKDPNEFSIGYKIEIYSKELESSYRNVKNTFSYERYKYRKMIYDEVKLISYKSVKNTFSIYRLRGIIINYIDKHYSENSALYLKELVLGISSFDQSYKEGLQKLGIIYLIAISGLHISIIKNILKKFLDLINVQSEISSFITSFILIIYGLLSINSISIRRAIIMNVTSDIAEVFNKKIDKLDSLSFSLFINLLINPFEVFSLGFYLSYLSTFVILINEFKNKYITNIFIISFSVPILLYFNHEISIFIILYSLAFAPIFSYFLIPFTYLTIVFYPIGFIYEFTLKILNSILTVSNNINLMISFSIESPLFVFIILFLLLCLYKNIKDKKKTIIYSISIGLTFLVSFTSSRFSFYPKVEMIDVGQGDSILLRSGFKVALIDTGESDNYDTTITYIKSMNIRRLDCVFISHTDSDHYGEYADISSSFIVKHFYLYKDNLDIKMGAFKIKSYCNVVEGNPNDSSMCLFVKIYNQTYLFTGDIESKGEDYILTKDIKDVTYLKVAHHGSNSSSKEELISKLNPKVSLISVGLNNSYGHPTEKVLERLNRYSKYIYRTDLDGSITITHHIAFSTIKTYRHNYILPMDFLNKFNIIY